MHGKKVVEADIDGERSGGVDEFDDGHPGTRQNLDVGIASRKGRLLQRVTQFFKHNFRNRRFWPESWRAFFPVVVVVVFFGSSSSGSS